MERMTALDAAFLYSEDGRTHNDIGMVLVLDGPAPSRDELVQMVAGRLPLVPRFRQKLRHLPFAAALPVWVDDPAFDLGRHIVEQAVGAVADPVGEAVSRVMSGAMDLTVPLWAIHLVRDLPQGRWMLVVRMHHAMADGVSSTEIVRTLLSPTPDGEVLVADEWSPRPEPTDAELLAAALGDAGETAAELARSVASSGEGPRPAVVPPVDLRPLMKPGIPVRATAINGPVAAGRRWGMVEVELGTIKALRKALDGTVNDILLAACARGFSAFLASRGEVVRDRVLRVMVPVSLRSPEENSAASQGGNAIGAMVVELPLGDLPAATCLARIREQTETFKKLKDVMPAPAINPTTDLISPMTLIMATRMASLAPTVVNTVITNVPGPQVPLYFDGRRMHRLGACIALWSPLRIAVSVLSYDGWATIGIATDSATFPDARPLLDAVEDALHKLGGAGARP